jgi:hypothetical protein
MTAKKSAHELTRRRPVEYSEELASQICGMIASGISLKRISQIPGMPSRSAILQWIVENRFPSLTERYRRARAVWLEGLADDLLDLADAPYKRLIETRVTKNGSTVTREVIDYEAVRARALQIDARKWLLSKLLPKVYGDFVHLYQETEERRRLIIETPNLPDWMAAAITTAAQQRKNTLPVESETVIESTLQRSTPQAPDTSAK